MVLDAEEIEANALPTVAALVGRVGDMEDFQPAEAVAPQVAVRLARSGSPMVDKPELRRVVGELTDQIGRDINDARKGSGSLGI